MGQKLANKLKEEHDTMTLLFSSITLSFILHFIDIKLISSFSSLIVNKLHRYQSMTFVKYIAGDH